ncbi:hypothetical protein BZA05DRAFT_358527 [Tricharina praecox]|uniref:uncharacterized protein n=1 Tax=Tricharina praecox TaxID=43433 RepID=UPI00221E989C|nr:uncharacterized protein BZA05DRAFT_358527 [Tricharina praecox]KAI5844785.1 hypothetical protein BZA05DRAFT_358527 [Tricharina praecox]
MADKLSESYWTSLLSKTPAILSSPAPAPVPLPANIAQTIDHTLLAPAATTDQIANVCEQAKTHGFYSVCVNSSHAKQVAASGAKACVVVGFPLGAMSTEGKEFETKTAISHGATEIDTVLAVGLLKSREYVRVYRDIAAVVSTAAPYPVKVIIETALLTDEEKVAACLISAEAGAAFVKTCTGFSGGAATTGDVALMRNAVEGYAWKGHGWDGRIRVKASAGVRTAESAKRMLEAGADRIGTSSGVAIMEGGKGEGY